MPTARTKPKPKAPSPHETTHRLEPRQSVPTYVFFCDSAEEEALTGVPQGAQVAYVRLLPSDIERIGARVRPSDQVREDAAEVLRFLRNEVEAGDSALSEHVERMVRVCAAIGV